MLRRRPGLASPLLRAHHAWSCFHPLCTCTTHSLFTHTPTPGGGCFEQTCEAATVGALAGGFVGSIQAAWAAKPQAGNRTLPLLVATGGTVARGAGMLAGVGAVYQG